MKRGGFSYKIGWLSCFLLLFLKVSAQDAAPAGEANEYSPLEQKIHALVRDVQDNNRTVDNLSEDDLADLPVGIARNINGTVYVIAIDSAYSDERGWFLGAYASIQLPGSQKRIAFIGRDIAFNKGGISATRSTRLILASPQMVDISENVELELIADGGNFLEFDCSGFKSVNLKGSFLFKADLLIPDQGLAKNEEKVRASFEINTSDLNNIIISTSITPFQIKGLKDVSFLVKNAVVDMSDYLNPTGFSFPKDYQNSYGQDIQLWRGFYLQEVEVFLPKELSSKEGRKSIEARNLIVDDLGVSGLFSANNLLKMDEGSSDGWPLSVNRISVQLTYNHLTGGGLEGAINVPFLGQDSLGYSADIKEEDGEMQYIFAVKTAENKDYKMPFGGTLTLNKGCIIKVEKRNNQLVPSAFLNGKMTVQQKLLNVKNIGFEKLVLTTEKPYLISGVFTLTGDGQGKTSGFPIQISELQFGVYQGQFTLGVGVALNMMNKSDKGFRAETYIRVLAKMEETTKTVGEVEHKSHKWKLDKVKIEDVIINCKTTAFTLNGRLSVFDDHPVYGNGFMGSIAFSIQNVLENGIKVTAYFGNKDDYRYWHVDAYVPTGNIVIVPPALMLNGIMGGMSYHMVRAKEYAPDFTKLNTEINNALDSANAYAIKSDLEYIPDANAGLSFMAGVTLVIANDKVVNADIKLEVAFNLGGGLKYVQFDGSAYFFNDLKSRDRGSNTDVKAPVYAKMRMIFDNDNNSFHANMKTYINLFGVLQGTGPGGLVGEAVIHFDPVDWYIHIGRPKQMMGLQILKLVSVQSYFMVGTKIEDLPLPPPEVREAFDKINLDFMREENVISTGKGFAMGLHFRAGFDGELGPFFAVLAVGGGSDMMLRYAGKQYCEGGGNKPMGIDGWRASGQAYVFMKSEVGVKFKSKKFSILSMGGAALLQAKIPNPSFMQGGLAGKYSILGGMVKGKFNLTFTLGEECKLIGNGNELGDLEVISAVKPDGGGRDVNVFTAPQISFNAPIERELTMLNDKNESNTYRVMMDELILLKGAEKIPGEIKWNNIKDVVSLKTKDILPPESELRIRVKIHWEKKLAGGAWEPLKENNTIDYEIKEATFVTGKAPSTIVEENVAYSYPVKGQYNFHKDEFNQGYLKLNWGQGNLFVPKDDLGTYTFAARFETNTGTLIETPLTYDDANTTVNFTIPGELKKETVYKLSFVKQSVAAGNIDRNVTRDEKQIATDGENVVSKNESNLSGTIAQKVEKELYGSNFRTSTFNTFDEKINQLSSFGDRFDIAIGNVAVIGKGGYSEETFDLFETVGKENSFAPLVQLTASTENKWFKETINPLLYQNYPTHDQVKIEWRKTEVLGVAPLKAVRIDNSDNLTGYTLSDDQVQTGFAPKESGDIVFAYFLSYYSFNDYIDLTNKAASLYLQSPSSSTEGLRRLLMVTGYTDLKSGKYPIIVNYTLPGINKVTRSREVVVKF